MTVEQIKNNLADYDRLLGLLEELKKLEWRFARLTAGRSTFSYSDHSRFHRI